MPGGPESGVAFAQIPPRRGYGVPRWVPRTTSMEADLGISKWAIVALVAAMIVVGTMGLVLRGGASRNPTPDRTPPASASGAPR